MKPAMITRKVHGNEVNFRVKSGKKGTGKTLFVCSSWINSRAISNALDMCIDFCKNNGYTVQFDNEEE